MATPRQLAYARQKNYQIAIDTAKEWATANGVAPWGHLFRLVFAIHTESKGLVYANDGKAFHPDPAQRRPGWDRDENGNPLPASVLASCYAAARKSLDFPHDEVGNNGGSTGLLQQLSQDYVGARWPGKTWGWGSLAKTMSVKDACWMFLDRVRVTSDRNYGGKDFDPIIADVLRVQQPLASEVAVNYGADVLIVAKAIVNNWGPEYFTKDFPPVTVDLVRTLDSEGTEAWSKIADVALKGPKGDPGPPGPGGGGARTSRGQVDARDLPGSDLADKLRRAWGSGDTREIIAQHEDVLDVRDSPIDWRAGNCLRIAGVAQTEFSHQGRLHVRGTAAVFKTPSHGTNFGNTKGGNFTNIGFEGQSHLKLFAPNPMNASASYFVYPTIEGCSFDTFQQLVESPMLGVTWDIRYINNIYGQFAVKVTGSDCQLWTEGGKVDWGQGNSVPNRRALLWFDGLEKSSVGSIYVTGEGSACIEVSGSDSRSGLKIMAATFEGRNATEQSVGAVARVRGAGVDFIGCDFNYAMANPGAGEASKGDRAFLDVSGGYASVVVGKFRRGNGTTAPFIAQRGNGVADAISCREVPSKKLVTVTNL